MTWPNGKRVAVSVLVMFEAWTDGVAPPYSVQTTSLKPGMINISGISWAHYGGKVGVYRLIRSLKKFGAPASFCTSARAAELFPDAMKQIVASGHDVAGHAFYQDELPPYLTHEEQASMVKRSIDTLERISGQRPKGWFTPVLAYTEDTVDHLINEKLLWHGDANDTDLPVVQKRKGGDIVAIPASEFTDNRVLKGSPRDWGDVYIDTFDFLNENEPMSLLVFCLHGHFGARPLMLANFERAMKHIASTGDAWFVSHAELAELYASGKIKSESFPARYFGKKEAV